MPSPQQILEGLSAIATEWRWLAIIWHVLLGAAILAYVSGWRPRRRFAGLVLVAPMASVSALAWQAGNPFNGAVFAILAVLLFVVAAGLPRSAVRPASVGFSVAGAVLVVFAWVYPHFLPDGAWFRYLYAAPVGLVPCPTLSLVIGLSLLFGGLGSRLWAGVLSASGLVYGLIGWLRLGVAIDAILLVGAITAGILAAREPVLARSDVTPAETGPSPSE